MDARVKPAHDNFTYQQSWKELWFLRSFHALLLFDAGVIDDRSPLLDIRRHAVAHLFGRSAAVVHAELRSRRAQGRIRERRVDLPIENRKDVRWHSGGRS